ncbi:hypothetical protein [Thioclava kandeliae]|uniref:Type I secretion protein n=1 Tax=Thioclava kandeliae TaxID=3070818 RepID=A0ABV1SMZ2_9RHOB
MKLSIDGGIYAISDDMFGGNILANRDSLVGDSNFSELVEDLGVTSLRYPGGSLTEYYFDITDPDQTEIADLTGNFNNDTSVKDFISLSDFMSFSSDNDISVTIVIPTRTYLSDNTDENGDRYAEIDEDALRTYVQELITGQYGDAEINAFEIGNEYWGSGEMSSVEYGRVSSEIAAIIDDELYQASLSDETAADIKILVQSGHNWGVAKLSDEYEGVESSDVLTSLNESYGLDLDDDALYSDGSVNWTYVANILIISEYNESELAAVDGITPHLYTSDSEFEDEVSYVTDQIYKTWGEVKDGVDIYVTEWNQNTSGYDLSSAEDYGLWQGQEILETFEEMVASGVDGADIWPLQQNTANALSTGFSYEDLTPAGQVFSLMAESLPGKSLIETSDDNASSDTYLYYGQGEVVMFISSKEDQTISLDLSDIVSDLGDITAIKVGVSDPEETGSSNAETTLTELVGDDLAEGTNISTSLAAGEILQVSIVDFIPTEQFQIVMDDVDVLSEVSDHVDIDDDLLVNDESEVDEADAESDDGMLGIPTVDVVDEVEDEDEDEDDGGGDDSMGFIGLALLVPLALLGLA